MQGGMLVFQLLNACVLVLVAQGCVGHDELRLNVHVAAQHDVRAATRHVGGNRDHTRATRLRHNQGLAFMLFCIQHTVWDALLIQQSR